MDHQTLTQPIPTPNGNVVIHIIGASPTGLVYSETSDCCCCSSPPPGQGARNKVYFLSLGVLVSSSLAALVMFLMVAPSVDDWTALKTTNLMACLVGVATSLIVRTFINSRSKLFYSSCAFLYFVVGVLVLTTVVIWLFKANMEVFFVILLGSPGVVCSVVSLVCSVWALKTACALLDTSGRVPEDSAAGVAGTQQQAAQ